MSKQKDKRERNPQDVGPYLDYLQPVSPIKSEYLHPGTSNSTYSTLEMGTKNTETYYQELLGEGHVDLSGKRLCHLSQDEVRKCRDAKVITLDHNEFSEIPEEIYAVKSLKTLSVASQISPKRASQTNWPALCKVPEGIHQLTQLSHLILCNNAIEELPPSFHLLKSLIHIDIKLNWFRVFPKCLCTMNSLKEIHASGNYIEVLPKEIGQLKNLESLRVGKNKIIEVPVELCQIDKLRCLSLRNNNLAELPKEICKLKGLICNKTEHEAERRLFLEGNPLEYPPVEQIGSDARDVFDYIEKHPRKHRSVRFKTDSNSVDKRKTAVDYPEKAVLSPEEAVENLKISVQNYGLVFRDPTPGDGSCFFHAVADQLTRPIMELKPQTHSQLRKWLVAYLKENGDEELHTWIEETTLKDFSTYLEEMAQDGTWADEIVVSTMAKALKRDIHVVTSSPDQMKSQRSSSFMCHIFQGGEGRPLLLGHYHEFHYQSLDLPESAIYDDTLVPRVQIGNLVVDPNETNLDLSKQELKDLPKEVLSLPRLKRLNLNNNFLINPDSWKSRLKDLPHLEWLSMREQDESRRSTNRVHSDHNYKLLRYIPRGLHFLCKNLTHLSMTRNKIESIPDDLFLMQNLEVLDLLYNFITEVPNDIQKAIKLRYLGLSSNKLTCIPDSIGNLPHLEVLRLSHNHLRELPETICNLLNLMVLSLAHNNLFFLPAKLYKLKCLFGEQIYECDILEKPQLQAGLWLDGNKNIEYPHKSLCGEGKRQIQEYLEDMDKKPAVQQDLIEKAREKLRLLANVSPHHDSRNQFSSVRPPTQDMSRPMSHNIGNEKRRQFQHLSDDFIVKLAKNIGAEWRMLGTFLDVPRPFMDQCDLNHPGVVREAITEMLYEWRNNSDKAEEDMVQDLLNALKEAGRDDLKDKIDKTYKRLSQMSVK